MIKIPKINPLVFYVAWAPFIAGLWLWAGMVIVPIIIRAFISLGIGFIVFKGFDVLFDQLEGAIIGALGGLPADIIAMLGIAKVDQAVSVVLSAISVRLLLNLFQGGKRKFMYFKA